tara:strand:+ start:15404 stop:16030 length:627 start_codon:yes stop_codon:yes gene_type:complete
MTKRSNSKLSRNGQISRSKGNFTAIQYGNDHGQLLFGKVHKDGGTTSGVMLQSKDGRHQFSMDEDGDRPGCTSLTSPGAIQFKCGMDLKEEQEGIFFNAENGDIDIIATNGKIRMQANDIELVSIGGGTDSGHIKMTASESITMDAKKINATAKNLLRLSSPAICELIANGRLKFISSVITTATDGCKLKDSKYNHQYHHNKEFSLPA